VEVTAYDRGAMTYIFYSAESKLQNGKKADIGMIEVLVNEALATKDQLVIDRGLLGLPASDAYNKGDKINIGAGGKYLFAIWENFNSIKGFTLCPYH